MAGGPVTGAKLGVVGVDTGGGGGFPKSRYGDCVIVDSCGFGSGGGGGCGISHGNCHRFSDSGLSGLPPPFPGVNSGRDIFLFPCQTSSRFVNAPPGFALSQALRTAQRLFQLQCAYMLAHVFQLGMTSRLIFLNSLKILQTPAQASASAGGKITS